MNWNFWKTTKNKALKALKGFSWRSLRWITSKTNKMKDRKHQMEHLICMDSEVASEPQVSAHNEASLSIYLPLSNFLAYCQANPQLFCNCWNFRMDFTFGLRSVQGYPSLLKSPRASKAPKAGEPLIEDAISRSLSPPNATLGSGVLGLHARGQNVGNI